MGKDVDCSCDDGEGPEFFNQKMQKAKKDYRCCECGKTIPASSIYQYTIGKWDGDMSTYRTCQTCVDVRARHCPNGYIFGCLVDHLIDSGVKPEDVGIYLPNRSDDGDDEG
jgi:hypothetical protein